jgi:hypothetical protein
MAILISYLTSSMVKLHLPIIMVGGGGGGGWWQLIAYENG